MLENGLKIIHNIFKKKEKIKIFYPILLLTLKQCDRYEYFTRKPEDIEFEFQIFYDLESYKQEIKLWNYELRSAMKSFITSCDCDVSDFNFSKASMGTGRRWNLLYRMKDNLISGHHNYHRIYNDFLQSNQYKKYLRLQKINKINDERD